MIAYTHHTLKNIAKDPRQWRTIAIWEDTEFLGYDVYLDQTKIAEERHEKTEGSAYNYAHGLYFKFLPEFAQFTQELR